MTSIGYRTRAIATTVMGAVLLFMLREVYLFATSDDPRVAALWLVVLGPTIVLCVLAGHALWTPRAEWALDQRRTDRARADIANAGRERPRHRSIGESSGTRWE